MSRAKTDWAQTATGTDGHAGREARDATGASPAEADPRPGVPRTTVRVTRQVPAPPARVFEAWTTPDQMKAWACPEGATVEAVEVDLRVGGAWEIRMQAGEERYTAHGRYRAVEPPARLVYTWDWREAGREVGETVVTVEFRAVAEGTEVVVVHTGFPSAESCAGHRIGWDSCLDRFGRLFS